MAVKPGDCWRLVDGAPLLSSALPKSADDDAAELAEGATATAVDRVLPNNAEDGGFLTVPRFFCPVIKSAHTSTVVGPVRGLGLARFAAGVTSLAVGVKSLAAGDRWDGPADGPAKGFAWATLLSSS